MFFLTSFMLYSLTSYCQRRCFSASTGAGGVPCWDRGSPKKPLLKITRRGWRAGKQPLGAGRADSGTRGSEQRDLGQKATEIYSQKRKITQRRQARNLRREGGVTSGAPCSTGHDCEQLNSRKGISLHFISSSIK